MIAHTSKEVGSRGVAGAVVLAAMLSIGCGASDHFTVSDDLGSELTCLHEQPQVVPAADPVAVFDGHDHALRGVVGEIVADGSITTYRVRSGPELTLSLSNGSSATLPASLGLARLPSGWTVEVTHSWCSSGSDSCAVQSLSSDADRLAGWVAIGRSSNKHLLTVCLAGRPGPEAHPYFSLSADLHLSAELP